MNNIDPFELRNAMGSFATGVTIITTAAVSKRSDESEKACPVAMTANSFSSVSLDPPLLLWSISKAAQSYTAFQTSGHFAVHILHSGQKGLSDICATKNADKFAEISWHRGVAGVPVFDDYNTCFECAVEHRYDGGDHEIIVGRIVALDNKERETHTRPLLFYQGKYRNVA